MNNWGWIPAGLSILMSTLWLAYMAGILSFESYMVGFTMICATVVLIMLDNDNNNTGRSA